MKGMFNVVLERWGEMLLTVFIFHVNSVPVLSTFTWGQGHFFHHVLLFFPPLVKKNQKRQVKENICCKYIFFFSSALQLSVRCCYLAGAELGGEGLGDLFLPGACPWRNKTQLFCALLQSYDPCQIVNVCNAVVFMDIPSHALLPYSHDR